MSAEDTPELQVFKSTAGTGSGAGADFVVNAFMEWQTYRALNQRVVNYGPTNFPTTFTSMLTCMQSTFSQSSVGLHYQCSQTNKWCKE